MFPKLLAAIAIPAALLLPATVAAPAEAAGVVTVTHAAAPAAAKPHHSHHRRHCHTRTRPCDKHKPAPRTANARAKVVAAARSFIGTPYRHGGQSHAGADCSGLVVAVYRQALGKRLPRTAAAQARHARRVKTPKPGDLTFWGSPAYHAAIYIGAGKVIVARHPGTRVQVQVIWGSPYFEAAI